MCMVYNETAQLPSHSPTLRLTTPQNMETFIAAGRRNFLPTWVLLRDQKLVAWACVRHFPWGPEICCRTGDLSIYISRNFQAGSVAPYLVAAVERDVHRYGFERLTVWFFSANSKTRRLAEAVGWKPWGLFPLAASFPNFSDSVEVWGAELNDPTFRQRMSHIRHLLQRRDIRRSASKNAT